VKGDGSVVAWGYSSYGGSITTTVATELGTYVARIYSTSSAFAALRISKVDHM
jgi:hypothetical protein